MHPEICTGLRLAEEIDERESGTALSGERAVGDAEIAADAHPRMQDEQRGVLVSHEDRVPDSAVGIERERRVGEGGTRVPSWADLWVDRVAARQTAQQRQICGKVRRRHTDAADQV